MERRRYSHSDDEDRDRGSRRRKEDLGQFLWTSKDPSGIPLRRDSSLSRSPSSSYSQDGPSRSPRRSAESNKERQHKYRASRSNSSERIPRRCRSGSSPRNNSHKYEKGMRSHDVESVSRKLGEETIEDKMDRYVKAAEREERARSRSSSDCSGVRRAATASAKYSESRSPSVHKSSLRRKTSRESPSRSVSKREKFSRERSGSSRERRIERRRGSEDRRPHRYRRSRSRSRSRSPIRYGRRDRSRDRPRRRRSRSRDRIRDSGQNRPFATDLQPGLGLQKLMSPRRRRSGSRGYRRRSRSRDYRRRTRSRSYDRHVPRSHPRRSSSRDRHRRRHHSRSSSHSKSRSRASSIDRTKAKAEPAVDVKVGSLPLSTTASAMTPQMALQQTMAAMSAKAQALTGVELPKYYNPAAVNPLKYAEQVQKRKLLWQPTEKPEQEQPKNSVWDKLTFAQDQDGKMTAKFRKLMGIKNEGQAGTDSDNKSEGSEKNVDVATFQKQEELFRHLDQQYEVARMSTHTHRGVGLGYSTQVVFPPMQRPT